MKMKVNIDLNENEASWLVSLLEEDLKKMTAEYERWAREDDDDWDLILNPSEIKSLLEKVRRVDSLISRRAAKKKEAKKG